MRSGGSMRESSEATAGLIIAYFALALLSVGRTIKIVRPAFKGGNRGRRLGGECCRHQYLQHTGTEFVIEAVFEMGIAFGYWLKNPAHLEALEHRIAAGNVDAMRSIQYCNRGETFAEWTLSHCQLRIHDIVNASANT